MVESITQATYVSQARSWCFITNMVSLLSDFVEKSATMTEALLEVVLIRDSLQRQLRASPIWKRRDALLRGPGDAAFARWDLLPLDKRSWETDSAPR